MHRTDSGKKDESNELEGDRSHVLSNLGVDESSTEMHPRRLSPAAAVYETRFRHPSIELVSEVMLPTKARIRAKNLKSKIDISKHEFKRIMTYCMLLYALRVSIHA